MVRNALTLRDRAQMAVRIEQGLSDREIREIREHRAG